MSEPRRSKKLVDRLLINRLVVSHNSPPLVSTVIIRTPKDHVTTSFSNLILGRANSYGRLISYKNKTNVSRSVFSESNFTSQFKFRVTIQKSVSVHNHFFFFCFLKISLFNCLK